MIGASRNSYIPNLSRYAQLPHSPFLVGQFAPTSLPIRASLPEDLDLRSSSEKAKSLGLSPRDDMMS